MPQFVLSYFGGDQPSSPEAGKAHFAKYQQWLSDLGDAVVSPMNPLKNTHTVLPSGEIDQGSASNMSGYTMLKAQDIEHALELVKGCPFLEMNGTLEIAERV